LNDAATTSHAKEKEETVLTAVAEEEQLRMRKADLEEEIIRLEQNPDQCDLIKGRYNHEFFYRTREYDKLFNTTPFPAPLKELGVCKSLVGWVPPKKLFGYNARFLPGGQPAPRAKGYKAKHQVHLRDAGGEQAGGEGAGWYSDILPTVIHTNVQLRKADNPWKADRVEVEDGTEDAAKKVLLKRVRSILNRITPTTKDMMILEFIALKVHESPFVEEVVAIIFEKAIAEPMYCPLYASLCSAQVHDELDSNVSQFRSMLLQRAQQDFNEGCGYFAEKRVEIDAEEDEMKKNELETEVIEAARKFRTS
ncbi:hypothetical protein PFISCL1PPCAC_11781, partial [Pristionchus fissidentatus]